jgi:glyoxylase-like metal-dependent hydrolase (beta-lactamase superfamily II)
MAPETGRWFTVSPGIRLLLAPNPGPMTLEGTNSYLLGAEDGPRVLVDPGPDDEGHIELLAAAQPDLVLITHRHLDHTAASAAVAARTGAPVRAADPEFCIGDAPLQPGEVVDTGAFRIEVVATPGHTDDSVSFWLPPTGLPGTGSAGDAGSMLTGDTILGRGTTVIGPPDGNLSAHLDSLDRLAMFGAAAVLPAHGPVRKDLAAVCEEYRAHRQQRLDQIRAALDRLGVDAAHASVAAVTDLVYTDIDPAVRPAAEMSVQSQLEHLRR